MRLIHADIVRVQMSLCEPLRTSQGTHSHRLATLVKVTTDDGIVGWGENVAPEGVHYVNENAEQSLLDIASTV